ncbi:hypothetical protein JDS87_12060 [Bacillus cereus]|uniref:hypothetical protein n=1 Tax=Bacillus cereus TaxID=1396 RepID=UPI0018F50489|nr:hypothetical protein [Bacillus cereus]MBJ8052704.1 hypothetical protein [Bacillus cereus]
MIVRLKNESARKIIRYFGGAVLLLIIASFLYQWNNGLVVDDTETFGFMLAFTGFLSTYLPTKKKATN